MAAWNLALRFGLELGALAGIAFGAWKLTSGPLRWVAVVALPVAAVTVWGVFNVPDDPSRSGAAPIEVNGWTRLAIELVILAGGAVALVIAGRRGIGVVLGVLIAAHYLASWARIEWLIQR